MKAKTWLVRGLCLALFAALLAGCAGKPRPGKATTADAVPRAEPESRYGNPESYRVFGKTYRVRSSNHGYREQGIASWYGPGFHGKRTSSGETYDMYAMTAAHTTLRLPAYVRVRNLENGKSVVVRVNDRGPFAGNRVIDLSYAAARQLGMIETGTALVELEVVGPGAPAGRTLAASTMSAEARWGENVFMQVGAFSQEDNARRMARRLRAGGLDGVREVPGQGLTRVWIGPLVSVDSADDLGRRLTSLGVHDFHVTVAP
ncbi:MAG: septal ring lytic transglycosylase RlpA family protein [Halothiobacillaceae bacterium]